MRTCIRTLLVGIFSFVVAASAFAQNVSVTGTVADETKAVLPGATVTATDLEAGKLADLIVVDGDPLARIGDAHKVKRVIANGRVYELNQLMNGAAASRSTAQGR